MGWQVAFDSAIGMKTTYVGVVEPITRRQRNSALSILPFQLMIWKKRSNSTSTFSVVQQVERKKNRVCSSSLDTKLWHIWCQPCLNYRPTRLMESKSLLCILASLWNGMIGINSKTNLARTVLNLSSALTLDTKTNPDHKQPCSLLILQETILSSNPSRTRVPFSIPSGNHSSSSPARNCLISSTRTSSWDCILRTSLLIPSSESASNATTVFVKIATNMLRNVNVVMKMKMTK